MSTSPDELHGCVDHVEVAQAEEVDLQEAERLHVAHRELGDDFLVGALLLERDDVRQRPVGDDDAGGVDRVLAHEALERLREVDDLAYERIRVVRRPELLSRLHRLLEVDLRPFGDELRDPVDGAVRNLEHAPGVAYGRARHHRPEGDDLRDAVAPVLLGGVVDDAVAPGHGEVDVDVGHGLPPRVEHALEEQVVLHRVDLGDAQAVGDERAGGRAASRADADAVLAGERDEVPDDQEVVGEAHLADRLQFECEPLVELGRPLRVTAGEPLLRELHEVLERIAALGRRVRRQQDLSQLERHRAALRDLEGPR